MKRDANRLDVRRVFKEIREDVNQATSQKDLTELYKRAGHMITMTHSTPLREDIDMKMDREIAEKEFARTVRAINNQAKKTNIEANFEENWKQMATNDYEGERENLLEPQKADE